MADIAACTHSGMKIRIEIVEAARKQVRVYGCELEPGVAQVDRSIKRRVMLLPLSAQPVLNIRSGLEHMMLKFLQRSGQCSGEMRNGHGSGL